MGAAYQWTSDVTERCHITHAKNPYRHSNHVDFHKQCCRFLDRDEKRRFFHLYILLKECQSDLVSEMKRETSIVSTHFSQEESATNRITSNDSPIGESRAVRNFFQHKRSLLSEDNSIALYINHHPHISAITVDEAAHRFGLLDLHGALGDFYSGKSYAERHGQRLCSNMCPLPFERLNIWFNFKIQRKSVQDLDVICPPATVQALPPNDTLPHGRCSAVLVGEASTNANTQSLQGTLNKQDSVLRSDTTDFISSRCRSSSYGFPAHPFSLERQTTYTYIW